MFKCVPKCLIVFWVQDDQVVLQCTASVLKEQIKLCLSCEGFGNRLCFLETTSNAQVRTPTFVCPVLYVTLFYQLCFTSVLFIHLQNVPPDLAICTFILEQSLSVRALQEMLANTVEMTEVGLKNRSEEIMNIWKGGGGIIFCRRLRDEGALEGYDSWKANGREIDFGRKISPILSDR